MMRNPITLGKLARIARQINATYSTKSQTYREAFKKSVEEPEEFWAETAEKLHWFKKYDKVIGNPGSIHPEWFQGGLTNMTYNCLDRHVEDGFGSQVAIIQDSPITGTRAQYTFDTVLDKVSRMAGYLSRECGVKKGDRVLIYMPMIPECFIAMLAAARIGAIHTVVFGGFSAEQLGIRIKSAKPKVLVTASFGVEPKKLIAYKPVVDEAIKLSGVEDCIKQCIIYQRPILKQTTLNGDKLYVDWNAALTGTEPHDAVPVESTHPLYLIYTSGTTGDPKGVVRDSAGYAVALKYTCDKVYDIQPGDVWWACSEFGWVVGHSYCGYAPLIQRATTIIYEGKPIGTPDAAQFFRVAAQNKVNGWFMTPSAVRAIRGEDEDLRQSVRYRHTEVNLDNLRNVIVAGEHCDASTIKWLAKSVPRHVRVSDSWWQTESGWPITACCLGYRDGYKNDMGLIAPVGAAGVPVPGYNIHLVDQESGNTSSQSVDMSVQDTEEGETMTLKRILIKQPLPPGALTTLWENDKKFIDLYFGSYPGFYDTMDLGYQDKQGFVYIMSRADDVINVSGHRLSTSALEEACLSVPEVVDAAVVAVPHDVKGHIPLGVLVKDPKTHLSDQDIMTAAFKAVRKMVGPVAAFNKACVVEKLPKTRSGKISRSSLADMASGKPVKIPITIEDATVYENIYRSMEKEGLNPSKPPVMD